MTTCLHCGKEIVTYYSDGEGPSWWLHVAYAQPECLSDTVAEPTEPEIFEVKCPHCPATFVGLNCNEQLDEHLDLCEGANCE